MSRLTGRLIAATLVIASLGCGGGGDSVTAAARLLVAGSNIERPHFAVFGGETWAVFYVRQSAPTGRLGGTLEARMVPWSGRQAARPVFASISDRPEWWPRKDARDQWFFMTDERMVDTTPVGTLNLVHPLGGLKASLADVVDYRFNSNVEMFTYRRHVAGAALPELHVHDGVGRDRNLGPVLGDAVWLGDRTLMFIAGDGALIRIDGIDGAPDMLHPGVTRFLPHEHHVVIRTTSLLEPRDHVLSLAEPGRPVRAVPGSNGCCWLSLDSRTFVYGEEATAERPAALHEFDHATGGDVATAVPRLLDVVVRIPRPRSDEHLVLDSDEQMAVIKGRTSTPLPGRGHARFSPDGRHLFVARFDEDSDEPAVMDGPLYVQEASDWSSPPRLASPPGVRGSPLSGVFVGETAPYRLIYRARTKFHGPHLYAAAVNDPVGTAIAQHVVRSFIRSRTVIAIEKRFENPDRGDLSVHDFTTGERRFVESAVTDANALAEMLLFVVHPMNPRGVAPGLWADVLPSAN